MFLSENVTLYLTTSSCRARHICITITLTAACLVLHSTDHRQVAPGVWVAIGYSLANSVLLEAPDGLIVVDTTEAIASAARIYAAFKRVRPRKQIRTIIYTHNHADHIFGAEVK